MCSSMMLFNKISKVIKSGDVGGFVDTVLAKVIKENTLTKTFIKDNENFYYKRHLIDYYRGEEMEY